MMIRFYNGRILRFGDGLRITDEEVWTDGSEIRYVGPAVGDAPEFERSIDLKGDLLMPGFKNAHAHTAMVFLRSMADDLELHSWLSNIVWPNEAKLDGDAVYWLTKLGIMEYLSSGITAAFDMYYNRPSLAAASTESGFRTVICCGMNDFDSNPEFVEEDYLRYRNCSEYVSYSLGFHGEYTTSLERMEYVASLAAKYHAPCFCHLSETRSEVDGCIERYGMTPPQVLDKIGFFDYGGGGFHCCHFSDEDVELFSRKSLYAVTCPGSNLKLASGIAPVEKLRLAGVPIAIGTDGAASNNALDMFREMYLTAVLQHLCEDNAAACPAEEVLRMACVNGARAMGLGSCDDIAEGKKADLIVIDMSRPNMQPVNNAAANIVYAGSKENVRLTMVNGRILYENSEFFIGDSPEKIYSECDRIMRGIKA